MNKLSKQIDDFQDQLDVLLNMTLSMDIPPEGHGGYLDGLQGQVNQLQECLDMAIFNLNKNKVID